MVKKICGKCNQGYSAGDDQHGSHGLCNSCFADQADDNIENGVFVLSDELKRQLESLLKDRKVASDMDRITIEQKIYDAIHKEIYG